ncbi:hypothetical protein HLBENOHH_02856 [Aeromonas dhakensis]|uniref:DUF4145 domain-containing protein n=1 Tax=Aeromonas TaxID=642 RepID=UPI00366E47C7
MICPHCKIAIHNNFNEIKLGACGKDTTGRPYYWYACCLECPSCSQPIINLKSALNVNGGLLQKQNFIAFPQTRGSRPAAPVEVPLAIANDYNESALVLSFSAQASAALSRRCLQHLLADAKLSTNSNLDRAITEAKTKGLPSHISDHLDAVRAIGNFAAHTQKSVNTGEILPVEPEEAEWNLDVLDMLFDFCYVQPAKNAARRAALDAKLAEAGKPPLK